MDVGDRRDGIPCDERARYALEDFRCDLTRAQTAQQSRDADVRGDDAQGSARIRDLEIVDAYDFATVDVDDLLIEKIANEKERVLGSRGRVLRRVT